MNNKLNIHFAGDTITPSTTRSKELARILIAFEEAIASVVVQDHRELKTDQVVVSLVRVKEGSLNLGFSAPLEQPVFEAAHKLFSAIQNEQWGDVPAPALRNIREIVSFTKRHNCVAKLSSQYNSSAVSALLSPGVTIPVSSIIHGETEIIGDVKRVGGVEPKVLFKTIQEQTLYCPTTEDLAKELAHYLYERIKVAGVATIDFETLAITDFEITRFVSAQSTPPVQAFKELSDTYSCYFDKIDDASAWSHEIRHGG